MTSLVFWLFLTYLVLLYNIPFGGLSWTPLPTLIWDVINERSLKLNDTVCRHVAERMSKRRPKFVAFMLNP